MNDLDLAPRIAAFDADVKRRNRNAAWWCVALAIFIVTIPFAIVIYVIAHKRVFRALAPEEQDRLRAQWATEAAWA